MKTRALISLAAAFTLSGLAFAQTTRPALEAVDARQVARQVQAFYDQTDTLQARFTQTYYHRLYRRYQRSRGRLVFDKPGRMRFDYDRPNGKVLVSAGGYLTAYEPGDDGEPGQYVKASVAGNAVPSAFAFLTGEARLLDDYRVALLDARRYRWSGHILELRPRRPDPRIRRILLYVDGDPARAGVVHRIRIDDHDGNRNKFELRRMRFNRDVPERVFRYAPPRGSRRVG